MPHHPLAWRDSDTAPLLTSGNLIGKAYVETGRGSFPTRWAEAAGDYLTLYDNNNRILIYSISSGKRIGQLFGSNGSLSPANPYMRSPLEFAV
jgi:hypothetical protein